MIFIFYLKYLISQFWILFRWSSANSFLKNIPTISSLFRSRVTCQWFSVLGFLDNEDFLYQVGVKPFAKVILYFDILTWSPTLNVSVTVSFFYVCFICLPMYTFFDTAIICLYILFFKVPINLPAAIDFPFLRYVFNTFQCYYHTTMTSLIYCKSHYPGLSIPFFVYALFIQNFMKLISDCNTFFNSSMGQPKNTCCNV